MTQIRDGAFETNSSSMHAIIVRHEPDQNRYYGSHGSVWDGILYIHDNSFQRTPFEFLDSWTDKAVYALASVTYEKDADKKRKEIIEIIKKLHPEVKTVRFPRDDWKDEAFDYGCIDHQSIGLLNDFLEKKNITLEEFINNPNYVIVIDGDEYDVLGSILSNGFALKPDAEIFRW